MHSPIIADIIIFCMIVAILASLGIGLFYLLLEQHDGQRAYRALAWRICLSMLLFLGLLLAIYFGWVIPSPPPL